MCKDDFVVLRSHQKLKNNQKSLDCDIKRENSDKNKCKYVTWRQKENSLLTEYSQKYKNVKFAHSGTWKLRKRKGIFGLVYLLYGKKKRSFFYEKKC